MAWILFEDRKELSVASVSLEQPSYFEIVLSEDTNKSEKKNQKVKKNVVLWVEQGQLPPTLSQQADKLAQEVDLDFLWELLPDDQEVNAPQLAREYFGDPCLPVHVVALWRVLWSNPIFFRKKSSGVFEKIDAQTLSQAKAALVRKEQAAKLQQEWVDSLVAGVLPDELKQAMPDLLLNPNKNDITYKALSQACTQLNTHPHHLLWQLGAIKDIYEWHLAVFLQACFPKLLSRGQADFLKYPSYESISDIPELPLATVKPFSIDDQYTTEIDDAFSVEQIGDREYRIGIHIAIPALSIKRDDSLDKVARERASTVYMPGEKITMLPNEVIEQFSLDEQQMRPCLSLYVHFDWETGRVLSQESRAERVCVAHNLRLNDLSTWVNESALSSLDVDRSHPCARDLAVLWRFCGFRQQERELVRGKPEVFNRYEFSFHVNRNSQPPTVDITKRQRGALLDRLVAELMIFANVQWGALAAEHHIPLIYRSQRQGRVEMGIYPKPHDNMGVAQYAWCTSPLRRYVDLVNQRQLLCALTHGVMSPLKAPYPPKDIELYAIISFFDAKYRLYGEFQDKMERYWSLYWIKQNQVTTLLGVVRRDNEVVLTDFPLTVSVAQRLPIGTFVRLAVLSCDEMDLSIEVSLIESISDVSSENSSEKSIQSTVL